MDKKIKILLLVSFFFLCFKILSIYFTNLSLHGDEAQYWLWSKDLSNGYFSKPPLLPFLIRFFSLFAGSSVFGIKLLSLFICLVSSVVVFFLTKKLYNNIIGYVVAITFFLIPGISFSSFIVSTDAPLLMFWTLSLYLLVTNFNNPNKLNAFFLGAFLGLGFLSKYAMIYFFICFFIYLFFERNFYTHVKKNINLYLLSLLVFLIFILPNIFWNINNSWLTFNHTMENINFGFSEFRLEKFYSYLLAQVFIVGPVLLFFTFIYFKKIFSLTKENIFLLSFSIPVLLIVTLESVLVRAHGNWAAVAYVSLVILFASNIYKLAPRALIISNVFNLILGFSFFYLVLISSSFKTFDQLNGYDNFSNKLLYYADRNNIKNIVIQDRMLFSLVGYHLRDTKNIFYTTKKPGNPIKHHFQIKQSLPEIFSKNFLYIGNLSNISYLNNSKEELLLEKIKINSKIKNVEIYKIIFN